MTELTQGLLKQVLDYDPATGVFRRRVGRRAGKVAGATDSDGYRVIKIGEKNYKAARLAFLWMTGAMPSAQSEHKNGVRDDNSWKNLRGATPAQNAANRGGWAGKHLPKGVHAHNSRFRAVIWNGGRNRYLGMFDTPEEAQRAYAAAAHHLHGEFARA